MTSLWRNFNGNVAASSNWSSFFIFCFLSSSKSATNCWQMEWQIHQDAWGSVCIACISQQCIYKNCLQNANDWKRNYGHLLTLQMWMHWSYVWGVTQYSFQSLEVYSRVFLANHLSSTDNKTRTTKKAGKIQKLTHHNYSSHSEHHKTYLTKI